MAITTILLDLDGTLLTMDNDEFTKGYFKMLVKKMAPLGYDPEKLVDSIWVGTRAMIQNDGSRTNMTRSGVHTGRSMGRRRNRTRSISRNFTGRISTGRLRSARKMTALERCWI